MNQPSTCIDDELLREKIKAVLADPVNRAHLMRTEPHGNGLFWRMTITVSDANDKLKSLPLMGADFGDKELIFHCVLKPGHSLSMGAALAGVGDAEAEIGQGGVNGGLDGLQEGSGKASLVLGGLNGFAGLKLDVEVSLSGGENGQGELEHTAEPTTKGELKAS